jgi:hypothetical protein
MTHPVISRRRQENPGGVIGEALRGSASQKPRRMLSSVISAESEGIEPSPIWADAAAPEIAIAVPCPWGCALSSSVTLAVLGSKGAPFGHNGEGAER